MTIEQIRPNGLDDWFAAALAGGAAGRPVLLDVREPAELQAASVTAGADFVVCAMPMRSVPQRLAELDPEQPVACLCHHGARSQRVALFLAQNGFSHVANVAGGIDAWALERDRGVPRY